MLNVHKNDDPPGRQSLRLPGYDYTLPGAYFVTICVHNRYCLFGDVQEGVVRLNNFGLITAACWRDLPNHYSAIYLDTFVIMSNHVHGIIVLKSKVNNRPISEIVRAFKTFSARRVNADRETSGTPVWQRGYHEHVIRNEQALTKIRESIANNPAKWSLDRENPQYRCLAPTEGAFETHPYK